MATAANDKQVDDLEQMVSSFTGALGNGSKGSIKYSKVVDKKREYIDKYPLNDNNVEEFIDWLRATYIRGGEFYLTLINEKGQVLTNQSIMLADLKPDTPVALRPAEARETRRDTDMFMIMMQNSQQQSSDNMKMMMSVMSSQQNSLMQMMGLIIPVMAGNKESPSELLFKMAEVQKSLAPPTSGSGVKDTLELMTAVKGFISDADPPEGIAGLMQSAAPLLAALLTGVQNQAAPPQAPQGTVVRQVSPQITQPGGAVDAPGPATGPIDPMQVQSMMVAKYRPLMNGIKQLILGNYPAEALAGYVEMKVQTGEIGADDAKMLYSSLERAGENLSVILALFDIVEPDHVEIIREAVALLVEKLDEDDEGGGESGDISSPGPDAQISD